MLSVGFSENNADQIRLLFQKQQYDLSLHSSSRLLGQATSVGNFRASTIRQPIYRGSYMSAHVLLNLLYK